MSIAVTGRVESPSGLVRAIGLLFAVGLYVNITKVVAGTKLFLFTTDLAVAGICAVACLHWLSGRNRTGAVELLVLAFGLVGAIELFHPNVPSMAVGLESYRRLVFQMLGLIVGLLAVRDRRDILFLWKVLALCSVPILLYAIKQFFVISDFDRAMIESTAADMDTWQLFGKIRSFGLFSGPFHLGLFAGIIFWIALALRSQSGKWYYSALATLAVTAAIASLTRSSVIALVGSVPVVLFLVMRGARLQVAAVTLTSVVVLLATFYLLRSSSDSFASIVEGYSVLESLQEDGRLQGRFEDYRHATRMFAEYPLGAGMGSASDAMGSQFSSANKQHLTSHNLLLWVGIETGAVGLLLFVGILISVGLAIHKLIRIKDAPMALAASGALVVVLITGMTGSTLSAYPVNLIFWTLSGCYIGYLRSLERTELDGGRR